MERLFSSPALYRTLDLFFRYPEEPLNPRLVSYRTGVDIKAVLRELRKLREMGILRVREAGRYRMYRLDRSHPLHRGLASLFGNPEDGGGTREDPRTEIERLDRILDEWEERIRGAGGTAAGSAGSFR